MLIRPPRFSSPSFRGRNGAAAPSARELSRTFGSAIQTMIERENGSRARRARTQAHSRLTSTPKPLGGQSPPRLEAAGCEAACRSSARALGARVRETSWATGQESKNPEKRENGGQARRLRKKEKPEFPENGGQPNGGQTSRSALDLIGTGRRTRYPFPPVIRHLPADRRGRLGTSSPGSAGRARGTHFGKGASAGRGGDSLAFAETTRFPPARAMCHRDSLR